MSVSEGATAVETLRPLTTMLADRAESDRIAFTFMDYADDRAGVPISLTWRELGERVAATAAEISAVTEPGDRIAVLAPQNLDYVVGFLGALCAGRIAVPLFAPEVSMHNGRLIGALADCAPKMWLTSAEAMEQTDALAAADGVPRPVSTLAVDKVDLGAGKRFRAPVLSADEPAYLQYTSGSTRDPAGAVITHRALVANLEQVVAAYGADSEFSCVGWLPFFHDMGLIQLICLPVFVGAQGLFTTPFSFIRKPVRWLRLLSGHRAAMSAAPNFAFDLAAKKVSDADRAELDLSGVRVVINGAEPVRAGTIERFAAAFGPAGFSPSAHRPSYGLAEATVFVSTTDSAAPVVTHFSRSGLAEGRGVAVEADQRTARSLVSAGKPVGQHARIVDPESHVLLEEGRVGEIWLHGPNLAEAYWEAPERTTETFRAVIADAPAELPVDRWMRTGDLGMYHGGQLYLTGRMKDLIIIDGKNHYPQDIESTVQDAHPAVRRDHVAAFSVDDGTLEGAVVVAERHRDADPELEEAEVAAAVKRAVTATHDVKLVGFALVPPGGVPRTSSGKVARAAAKARYAEALRQQKSR